MQFTSLKNVLLIDDNEITNLIQSKLLIDSGFADNIIIKDSGLAGLEYLRYEITEDNVPDLIFLDIRMPFMDGFGFLKEYNGLPSLIKNKTKIVMVSSSLDESDKAKIKAANYVVDFIVKPLSLDGLKFLKIK